MTSFEYFIDHLPGLIAALGAVTVNVLGVIIAARQNRGQKLLRDFHADFNNGGGDRIADKTVKQMEPVIARMETNVVQKVADNNEIVAAVLAEKTGNWDGIDRRKGPPDRRGP